MSYEQQGTAHEAGAAGHEKVGRAAAPPPQAPPPQAPPPQAPPPSVPGIVPMVRPDPAAPGGWSLADVETAIQLFSHGLVTDGQLKSRGTRDYLVSLGYAVRAGGLNALTGKGTLAFFMCGPLQDAIAKLRAADTAAEPLLGSPEQRRRARRGRARTGGATPLGAPYA